MAKAPKNLPEEGDRCCLRGRDALGYVRWIDKAINWSAIWWDENTNHEITGPSIGRKHPVICHLYELEKIEWQPTF